MSANVELYLGDCLEVMKTLPDNSVDAVVTDPPYCSGGRQPASARNTVSKSTREDDVWLSSDTMGVDSYLWFMRQVAREAFRQATLGSPAYVFTDWRQYSVVVTAWESAGWALRSVIVWDKNRGGAMGSWWRSNHEWVCAFAKGMPRPLSNHSFFNTWQETKPQGGAHPTEKPVALCAHIVKSITPDTATVVDCFMGSGTTGVACVQTGRNFIGIEIDPGYFAIAKRRIEEAQMQPRLAEAVQLGGENVRS